MRSVVGDKASLPIVADIDLLSLGHFARLTADVGPRRVINLRLNRVVVDRDCLDFNLDLVTWL